MNTGIKVEELVGHFGFSQKEALAARGVAQGLSNADIARNLGIVEKTVKFHLTTVFRKARVKNRTELALKIFAVHNGLV